MDKLFKNTYVLAIGVCIILLANILVYVYIIDQLNEIKKEVNTMIAPPPPDKVQEYIKKNSTLPDKVTKVLAASIKTASVEHDLPIPLMLAVIKTESNFKQHAVSTAGALGFWQVIPKWHQDKIGQLENKDIYHPATNTTLGAKILKMCIKRYSTLDAALSCYNGSQHDTEKKYARKVFAAMSSDTF